MLALEPCSVPVVIPKLLTLLASLLVPVVTGPDEMGEENTGNVIAPSIEAPADTILRPNLDLPAVAVEVGLSAMQSEPHVTLGMRRIRVSADGVGTPRSEDLASYREASGLSYRLSRGRRAFSRLGPGVDVGARLIAPSPLDVVLRSRTTEPVTSGRILYLPTETRRFNPILPSDKSRFVTEYADLALNVRSRMELGGDWTRFEPCDARFGAGCNPSIVPQLSPDLQFGVQVNGTILDRVTVDVDFDQSREFDAANRINFFYEGGKDDVLHRLEVGDVTFRLPQSRFLTEGLPAGNFGFQAEGQVGPVDFQTVWAQQRGDLNSRSFQLTGFGDQRAFVQEDTLVLDDADYVRGQFFFLVDPSQIDRYPHVDALELDPASAPASIAPGDQLIQLYRFEDDPVFQQQVEGFIQLDAVADDGVNPPVRESGWFRNLQQGSDFFVHPSGLWIALRQPLSREEMLAVTYITAAGDTIGDYNPELVYNQGGRPELRLLKASGANHQPGRPTWDLEMHQVYRVSGSADVEPGSVSLSVSLGELSAGRTFKRSPYGADITFLRLFGLDEEAPLDALDPAFIYSPGLEFFQDQPPVQGSFIVFPTLRPFSQPPPVESLRLSEGLTQAILGDDANQAIYEEEDPFERVNSGRFRLTFSYRLRSEGVISAFSLGAFGIRDGSERIFLGDRVLTRGADYEIDYNVGQVQLLEPDLLFASSPDATVRATWEQRSLFQVTPTQVVGLRTSSALGSGGGIDFLGLYQSERSVVTRPILGTEPGAAFLSGLSGRYDMSLGWFDRFLEKIPGLNFDGASSLSADGEVALSIPNPNTLDQAFVDDFDGTAQLSVGLTSQNWQLSSAPTKRDGAEVVMPAVVDETTAASLVWQNRWILLAPNGDSLGVREGLFPRTDIDNQIRLAGSELREPGLRLSLGSSLAEGQPGWRSVMTPLSTNGLDLTKTDYLEFYASHDGALSLIIDLGTVSEDAFFVGSFNATSGSRSDGRSWGLGNLDQEADPRLGEIWSDIRDELGVWGETCLAERGSIYPLGDSRSVCTRGNGRPDSEDLDADGNLDTAERHLRYVVSLDGSSPFLARNRSETGTDFQLYRIPLRGAGAVEVGGSITEADLRAIRHLRVTAVGAEGGLELARMRLIGSRWIKRSGDGVLDGIVGDTLSHIGRVEVASVSQVTEGSDYVSPPGVLEELTDPTQAFSGQGIEFNEKSLGIKFERIPDGARAEVYYRFPQRPRDFLSYREARLWAIAKDGDFGPTRANRFFLKVGSDPENFYLYRTPLSPPVGPGLTGADWLPEVRVDFGVWLDLRRQAEELVSMAPPAPGDPPVQIWSADSTYAVVLADRGRAPNLAAVREISIGVWNETGQSTSGEIWVDELRLGQAVNDVGIASSLNVAVDGAGVIQTRLNMTDRGAFFRQLRDRPTYQDDRTLNLFSSLAVDRWFPSSWGVDMPVTFEVSQSSQAPVLLANSDVRVSQIANLRDTNAGQRRVGISMRKRTQSSNRVVGFLVDGLDARASYATADGSTITTENESSTVDAGVGWTSVPQSREIGLVPTQLRGLVRTLLPGFLEDKVADARLRLTPERVSLSTSYFQQDSRVVRYETIVRSAGDQQSVATLRPRELMQVAADVRLRPLPSLVADMRLLQSRDLLQPEETVTDENVQQIIREQRSEWLGLDFGWETTRTLRTDVGYRPSIFSWLRTDFDWTTVYQSDRNTNFIEQSIQLADTMMTLTRNAQGQRDWGGTVSLSPSALAVSWFGSSVEGEDEGIAQLRSILSAIRPLSATYRDGITSRFNRDPVDPRFDYQLGFGGRDRYRFVDADTAATLTDRASWRLSSGVGLPGGAGLQVGYLWSDSETLDVRSDRNTRQKTWPDVQATLPAIRLPSFTGIRSINLSSGIVRTEREITFGGRALQRRFDSDLQVPLDVSIQWLRTLVTAYRGAWRDGNGLDPTGDTERQVRNHRISLNTQLLLVGGLASSLDRPISLSIIGTYRSELNCRITVAEEECVPFIDQVLRTVSLQADTSLRGFSFGLRVSYDDRQSFVGQQTGSTQFQVGLFGQLDFGTADFPIGPVR
ncbi:MAG: cell surface protein SprA [Gemmatimonadetes bacterium]|nr:cell surface protein SprA [Gemmatimonadota bacterium]